MGGSVSDEALCPVSGKPIFIDQAALARPAPTLFVCPCCGHVHQFHVLDRTDTALADDETSFSVDKVQRSGTILPRRDDADRQ
jgi:hypothetical protein